MKEMTEAPWEDGEMGIYTGGIVSDRGMTER